MEETKREINYVSLSKAMSKALRHRPERLGITLEKDGSVELDVFVDALNRRGGWPRTITEADIMEVVDNGSKKRFAVEGGRIRARYGHSIKADIAYAPADPPEILFHGTAPSSVASIMRQGLLPMGRKTVHLSTDVETARLVGSRHGGRATILVVDAGRAANDGVAFYRGNDDTWLSETIPSEYLRVSEDS